MTQVNPEPQARRQIEPNLKRVDEELLKEDVPGRFKRPVAALHDRDKGENSHHDPQAHCDAPG